VSVFPRLLSLPWTPSNSCCSLKFGVVYPDIPLLSGDTLLVTPIVAEVVSDAFEDERETGVHPASFLCGSANIF
jgi:hypothetical protein